MSNQALPAPLNEGPVPDRVLLTGISGFIGGHVGLGLLDAGYRVRGSVRSPHKAQHVRETLARAGADISRLELVVLDLLDDRGWAEAAEGCRYVQHTASPLHLTLPRDADEVIRPAVEGTRRAVGAALAAGAERIVLTSSMAAIAYGHAAPPPLTEADWTDPEAPGVNAYCRSKTLAERQAWQLVEAAGAPERLAVINPSVVLGPLLDADPGTSAMVVIKLLNGTVPAAPRIAMGIVDVRDVAALHLAAMESPEAGARRFIASQDVLFFMEIADALRQDFPAHARRLPRFELPNWMVRLYALCDRRVRDHVGELGTRRRIASDRAETLIGRPLIPARDAIRATAQSAMAHKLI